MNELIEKDIMEQVEAKYFKLLEIEPFEAKMIESTNIGFSYLLNYTEYLKLGISAYYGDSFHTSYLQRVEVIEDIIFLKTRNSVYTFEIIEKDSELINAGILLELSVEEIEAVENHLKKRG